MYQNSTIYLTNIHKQEKDIADDIVHEIAHSVEETHYNDIYSDGLLEKEFLFKREKMWDILKYKNLISDIGLEPFLNINYDFKFDEFLYKSIGYGNLRTLTSNLFFSPYGSTSLREYFANGFEAFFYHKEINKIKSISPVLFGKLSGLLNKKNNTKKEYI